MAIKTTRLVELTSVEKVPGTFSTEVQSKPHSPTKRDERKQYAGSISEREPGKQGEIPRPLVRKGSKASALEGLPWGIDTFHITDILSRPEALVM